MVQAFVIAEVVVGFSGSEQTLPKVLGPNYTVDGPIRRGPDGADGKCLLFGFVDTVVALGHLRNVSVGLTVHAG